MKPQAGASAALERPSASSDTASSRKPPVRLLVLGSDDKSRSALIAPLLAAQRAFVAADTPAPEHYVRNLASGVAASDVALIIVDTREGITLQTRRHAYVAALLGIRNVAFVLDQTDLIDDSAEAFERISADFAQVAAPLAFASAAVIPVSARHGDNVAFRSGRMDWYAGPTLLGYLEAIELDTARAGAPFRFIVQSADRSASDACAFTGTVASGSARVGDSVVVATAGRGSQIARLRTDGADVQSASAGDAVTLVLADAIDLARGDVLACAAARPQVSSQFAATVLWMSEAPLLPGRSYLLRAGAHWVPATITSIKHKLDVASHEHLAARTLEPGEVAFCNLSTANPIAFDPFVNNPATGAFILVDRASNETVGAGMIEFALRRASNIHHEELSVSKPSRAALKHQSPAALWFTGLSGSGKSTIAKIVERKLHARGYHTYMLDGDNLRHGLTKDLGFSQADRVENIRRAGEVAKLFVDAGLIVICSFISPFNAERDMVRSQLDAGEFIEIFIDTPIEECMRRDPKGLYAKAQAGQIKNFTGFDSPYETPSAPELVLPTTTPAETLADRVLEYMALRGLLK